jgi:uncharacterized protein YraI
MKSFHIAAIAGVGLLAASATSSLANVANGFVTSSVTERAGPSTAFPPVAVIPAGAGVTIYDCLSDDSWCDVSWGPNRGWVASSYLQAMYQSQRVPLGGYISQLGIPFIVFDVDTYWNSYYRGRPFYGQRSHWHNWHPRGNAAVVGKASNKYVSKKLGNGSGNPSKVYVKSHNKVPKVYVKPHSKSPKLNGPKFKSSNHNGPKPGGSQGGGNKCSKGKCT